MVINQTTDTANAPDINTQPFASAKAPPTGQADQDPYRLLPGRRRVFIRDFTAPAEIGVWHHERGRTQKICLNLDLIVTEGAQAHQDQLEQVVCYNDIVIKLRSLLASGHINLVETLAEKIAAMLLSDQRILSVVIRVEKLEAIEDAASVGVEIARHQANINF